jgi:hypothetical protein
MGILHKFPYKESLYSEIPTVYDTTNFILALAEKTLNLFPAVEMFLLAVRRDSIEG